MQLEAATTDKVFCGEQQSESDHFFKSSNSWNGYDEGMHWRITRTSISYQMKAQGATTLRIKGFAGYERIVVSIDVANGQLTYITPYENAISFKKLAELTKEKKY